MKKLVSLVLAALLFVTGCAAFSEAAKTNGLKKDIVVLYTSDIHCGTNSGFGIGAMLEARKYFEKDNHVILADIGDAFQGGISGALTGGKLIASIMALIRYDIATVGNHDFDFGIENMYKLFDMSDCPRVCVNVLADGKPVLPPYMIKEFDGVKVAFVGAVTPTTATKANPAMLVDSQGRQYTFAEDKTGDKLAGLIQNAVDSARGEGADYVILLSHLGTDKPDEPYTSKSIVRKISGIDAVLDGHSHDKEYAEYKDKDGKTVPRQGVGTKMEAIGCLRIGRDGKLTLGLYRGDDPEIPKTFRENENRVTAVHELVDIATSVLESEKIGETDYDLVAFGKARKDDKQQPRIIRTQETNLGDLLADAYRAAAGTDIAIINSGSVRSDIKKGAISTKNIFEVLPYMNRIAACVCSGQDILDMLEMSVHALPEEYGGFLQVSGLTFDVRTDIPSPVELDEDKNFVRINGERRVSNVKVGGKPVDPKAKYTLGSTDGLLRSGLDGYVMFKDHEFIKIEDMFDYEALVRYIQKAQGGKIGKEYSDPNAHGRINILKDAGAGAGKKAA